MKKLPLATVSLTVLLAHGCVTERSLTDSSVRAYIGSRFRTTRPFFLAKEGGRYVLLGQRQEDIPADQAPTLDEFRQGRWKNRTFDTVKFLKILPEGSVIEITDIVRQFHVEAGISYLCYGRVLDDGEFEGFRRIDLSFVFPDCLHPDKMTGGEKL